MDWWTGTIDEARMTDAYANDDLMSGQAWAELCDSLRQASDVVLRPDVPGAPLDRAEGFRHLLALVHIGIGQALDRSDPFWPSFGQTSRTDIFKWGLDCPDSAYRGTAIRGDLTYRITGTVGTVRYLSFQVNEGMRNHGNLRGDQLTLDTDGGFELWVGPDKHDGDWLRTPAEADAIIVRQFFYDWDREAPATLSIELAGGAERPTEPDDGNTPVPDRVARQLRAVGRWLNANAQFWADIEIQGQASCRNAFQPATAKPESGGAEENVNGWGHYDLGPDEAMIIEVRPAVAHYWSLHLGNFWWESLDYASHQTSLNGHQAILDDDGVFRAVLAHRDPGVPNWLDTMGHQMGPMLFRWVLPDVVPEPVCTVVPHDDIRQHLPERTPVVDAATRAEHLSRRRAHVLRRFAC